MTTLYNVAGNKFTATSFAAGKYNGYWNTNRSNRVWVKKSLLATKEIRKAQGVVCK